MASKLTSQDFVYGVYIPSAVMMFGVGVAAYDWLPYALVFPLILGGYQFVSGGTAAPPPLALKKDEFQEFRLEKKTVLSHNVAIYRFSLHAPHHILGLPIGQHMSVTAHIEGTGNVMRSYTPISSDEDPGFFDLLIKSYPQGNISKHMGTLRLGDTLKVRGPKGAMVYKPGLVKRFGMIAGGTGITPMLQIIRAIHRGRPRNGGNDTTEVDLIFANVNSEDILLKSTLDALAKEDTGFRVHYVLNNPPEKWDGGVGFVTVDMIKQHLPPPASDIKILLCGPPPMVKAMTAATESLGYDKPSKPTSKLHDQVFCF